MKSLKIFLFLFLISCTLSAQVSDGTLLSEINSKIYAKPYFPKNHGDVLTDLVNSKPSLLGSYANPSWITSLAASKITGNVFTLTTTGTNGAATYSGGTLNIPNYSITLTTTGTSGSATLVGGTLNIPNYTNSGSAGGDLSGTYPNPSVVKINGTSLSGLATGLLKNTTGTGVPSIAVSGTDYQSPITLTTTGTSGAATFIGNTINIPNYSGLSGLTTGIVPYATSSTTIGDGEIIRSSAGVYSNSSSQSSSGVSFNVTNTSTSSSNPATAFYSLTASANSASIVLYNQNNSASPGALVIKNSSSSGYNYLVSTSGTYVSNITALPFSITNVLVAAFRDGSNTSTVGYPFRIYKDVLSGTPAIGIGTGMEFQTQTGASTYSIGSRIESVSTNVTSLSESFDLVFRVLNSGSLSERLRLTSYGLLTTKSTVFTPVSLGSVGSSQNDYNIGDGTTFVINPTAGINITGISGGVEGRIIYVTNVSGSFGIGFPDASGSSIAANRFSIPGGFTLASGNTCQFVYVNSFWRLSAKTN